MIDDFNGDGNLDIAAVGNDYGTEVSLGRYDAMNGLIMLEMVEEILRAKQFCKAGYSFLEMQKRW